LWRKRHSNQLSSEHFISTRQRHSTNATVIISALTLLLSQGQTCEEQEHPNKIMLFQKSWRNERKHIFIVSSKNQPRARLYFTAHNTSYSCENELSFNSVVHFAKSNTVRRQWKRLAIKGFPRSKDLRALFLIPIKHFTRITLQMIKYSFCFLMLSGSDLVLFVSLIQNKETLAREFGLLFFQKQ
jgi:hypothetical protein